MEQKLKTYQKILFAVMMVLWSCSDQMGGAESFENAEDNRVDTESDTSSYSTSDDITLEDPVEEGFLRSEREPDSEPQCDNLNDSRYVLYPKKANATAGPTLARAIIRSGRRVDIPVRVSEFLNYYKANSWMEDSDTVAITAGINLVEEGDNPLYDIYAAVAAPTMSNEARTPLNLTIAIDTSKRMDGEALSLAKNICSTIVRQLRSEDTLSITTLSSDQAILVDAITPGSDATIDDIDTALKNISISDETDLAYGLQVAYAIARENSSGAKNNRVMLISDGNWEIGITNKDSIATDAKVETVPQIQLIAIGVSNEPSSYNAGMMRIISEAGRGAHIFIDSESEADRVFRDNFASVTEVEGAEVTVNLTLPPGFQILPTEPVVDVWTNPLWDLPPSGIMVVWEQAMMCGDSDAVDGAGNIYVSADYVDPGSRSSGVATFQAPVPMLVTGEDSIFVKINAVKQYAETLQDVKSIDDAGQAADRIDQTIETMGDASKQLPKDEDIQEIQALLEAYRDVFVDLL